MPLIPPLLAAALRRQWPLVGMTVVFVLFMLAHTALFQPAATRYKSAVARAHALGLSVDPVQPLPVLPPRVFARVANNALAPAAAVEQGSSGVLAARLLEEIAQRAQQSGIEVVASEPGPVSQQTSSTTVRAHVTMRGRYGEWVAFLDALARGDHLIAVDRFTVTPQGGSLVVETWMSRLVLKREEGHR